MLMLLQAGSRKVQLSSQRCMLHLLGRDVVCLMIVRHTMALRRPVCSQTKCLSTSLRAPPARHADKATVMQELTGRLNDTATSDAAVATLLNVAAQVRTSHTYVPPAVCARLAQRVLQSYLVFPRSGWSTLDTEEL
jgi:hypothetical protein